MTLPIKPPDYGSDQTGLICGFEFFPGRPGRSIEAAEAAAWWRGARDPSRSGFLWLHFNLANAATERWLKGNLSLSDVFFESLRGSSNSTRIEHVDDALIAVTNDVLFDFAYDASHIATLWLNVSERLLVTAREKPLRTIDRLREAVKVGALFRSPVEMLAHLLRDQADVLVQIVRSSVGRMDSIEDSLLAERLDYRRSNLGQLRRVLIRLQRVLAPEPAAMFRLMSRPPAWIAELDVQELRQASEEFSVAL